MNKFISCLKIIAFWLVHGFMLLLSIYLLWGWITISDIKRKAIENNHDPEQVMKALLNIEVSLETKIEKDAKGNIKSKTISTKTTNTDTYLSRLVLQAYRHTDDSKGNISFNVIYLLDPFLRITGNVANFMFCFGIGYLISLVIIAVRYMKGKIKMTYRYLLLRPIVGAFSASCFFLIIVSGGTFIWENVSNVKGLSLGLIAVFGALYCEKFETILANSIKGKFSEKE